MRRAHRWPAAQQPDPRASRVDARPRTRVDLPHDRPRPSCCGRARHPRGWSRAGRRSHPSSAAATRAITARPRPRRGLPSSTRGPSVPGDPGLGERAAPPQRPPARSGGRGPQVLAAEPDESARTMTAPQLFARVRPAGNQRCFYCGGQCTTDHAAKEFVKPSFTERDQVRCGSSEFVCVGCVETLNDKATITMLDGEVRAEQKTRNYSWVITESRALAATKAHREQLLSLCLSPPERPYAICLADGQKHQLWRTPLNTSRDSISVNLEGTSVTFSAAQLLGRLAFVNQIIGCVGKMAASSGEPSRLLWPRMAGKIPHQELQIVCEWWDRVRLEPITRLSIWLAPGKDSCNE